MSLLPMGSSGSSAYAGGRYPWPLIAGFLRFRWWLICAMLTYLMGMVMRMGQESREAEARAAELSEQLERALSEEQSLRSEFERAAEELRTLNATLRRATLAEADLRSALQSTEDWGEDQVRRLEQCEGERRNLLTENNATLDLRAQVEELEEQAEELRSCCDSIPMCSLCILRSER
mmetsp:Transcript_37370/g.81951  ORF Transcript_37370/g.81951 Transcript_37370/m.81951 type:complete len:177 (-) Transcript_37370:143-673(-)